MKIAPVLEREIAHLGEEDFKKIFPNQYYSKYAAHHNVSKFETQLIKQTKASHPQTIIRSQSQPKLQPPTIVTRFDPPTDVISKNKQQTKRMHKFVKNINNNIKAGPNNSKAKIRSPLTGFAAIPQGVVDRLKIIQDAQYQAQLQYLRAKKSKAHTYMNFVPRSRYNSVGNFKTTNLEKSLMASSIQSKSIRDCPNVSNTMLLHSLSPPNFYPSSFSPEQSLPYSRKVQQILQNTRSQIVQLNPEDKHSDLKTIMAMNKSIRKMTKIQAQMTPERRNYKSLNTKKLNTTSSYQDLHSTQRSRRDLVGLTESVRKQVHGMEMLSHYKETMSQRDLKLRLQKIN